MKSFVLAKYIKTYLSRIFVCLLLLKVGCAPAVNKHKSILLEAKNFPESLTKTITEGDTDTSVVYEAPVSVTNRDVELFWYTVDGSAKENEDYIPAKGKIFISSQTLNINLPIVVQDDSIEELTEYFTIKVSALSEENKEMEREFIVYINDNDSNSKDCTETVWTPSTDTVCDQKLFNQTSNCGTIRSALGSNSESCCEDTDWTPASDTICTGSLFTQISNCGSKRRSVGTMTAQFCYACDDISWSPAPDTICEGRPFNQTSNCGTPRRSVGTKTNCKKTDIFNQNTVTESMSTEMFTYKLSETPVPVDILWVIDDSGSMEDNQIKLANGFNDFIENFAGLSIEFKMAVITTTHSYDRGKKLNSKFLKNNKQGFIEDFKATVKVGTGGSGNEIGLRKSEEFLSGNPNWINTDNYLVIIFLSDEDDHGAGSVRSYVDWIAREKEGGLESVQIYSIVTMEDVRHLNLDRNRINYREKGTRYIEAARMTGGKSTDIDTGSFGSILNSISRNVVKLIKRPHFKLKEILDANRINDVEVFINGNQLNDNSWIFSSKSNSIRLVDSSAVSDGSKVKITYPVTKGSLKTSFILSKSVDIESPNIIVRVDNIEIPSNGWALDGTRTIKFKEGFIPASGARIEISYRHR